ncbi:hypothetical protein GCM10022206_51900 [Streptomyces chiangmaiensis]
MRATRSVRAHRLWPGVHIVNTSQRQGRGQITSKGTGFFPAVTTEILRLDSLRITTGNETITLCKGATAHKKARDTVHSPVSRASSLAAPSKGEGRVSPPW